MQISILSLEFKPRWVGSTIKDQPSFVCGAYSFGKARVKRFKESLNGAWSFDLLFGLTRMLSKYPWILFFLWKPLQHRRLGAFVEVCQGWRDMLLKRFTDVVIPWLPVAAGGAMPMANPWIKEMLGVIISIASFMPHLICCPWRVPLPEEDGVPLFFCHPLWLRLRWQPAGGVSFAIS
jgi:hypothetical protein